MNIINADPVRFYFHPVPLQSNTPRPELDSKYPVAQIFTIQCPLGRAVRRFYNNCIIITNLANVRAGPLYVNLAAITTTSPSNYSLVHDKTTTFAMYCALTTPINCINPLGINSFTPSFPQISACFNYGNACTAFAASEMGNRERMNDER